MASTGIRTRHGRACASRTGRACNCHPSYEAWVWSPRDRRKIRRTFETLAAAKGWRHDAASGVRKGTVQAPTRQTLEQAAEAWLAGAKTGAVRTRSGGVYKPAVLRNYERDLRAYVLPDLGAHPLARIRRADLQTLVDRLLGAGRGASKIHAVVMPVRAICRHAIERDELLVNPTSNLRLPAATGRRERVASPGEVAELLDALPEDLQALYAAAAYGGLRRGELRALRVVDVDYPAVTLIRVERGWDDVEGPIGPKSQKGERSVPVAAALRRYLLEEKMRTGRDGEELLFGRTSTEPFTPTHVRERALAAWRAAGLEPIGLHELRHTYVSLMHAAGCSLEEIGDYIGHSSTYITDRYRHLLEGERGRAADKLDALLTGAKVGAHELLNR
jgi:integrase